MNTKAFIIEFSVVFMITFIIASIVSLGWNYFYEGIAECNWATAFQFALIFGILCPMIDMMRSNR